VENNQSTTSHIGEVALAQRQSNYTEEDELLAAWLAVRSRQQGSLFVSGDLGSSGSMLVSAALIAAMTVRMLIPVPRAGQASHATYACALSRSLE
jgi:hypothetical protein